MTSKRLVACFLAAATLGSALTLSAQTPAPKLELPAASPQSTLKQRVGVTDIEVVYSRPGVKGRKIFGGLEQFGAVWRTGANNATKITFSTAVKFGGQDVPAGTYSLFSIPGEKEWTVILGKSAPRQWGAYGYESKDDVVRVAVKPVALTDLVETFTIDLNDIRDGSATLNLIWEKTRVPVGINVDLAGTAQQVEALMSSDADKKNFYAPAAMFYLENNLDLAKAETWMDAAIAERPAAFYLIYRKALIQEKRGNRAGALASAQQSMAMAEKDTSPAKDEYVRLNKALIARLQ